MRLSDLIAELQQWAEDFAPHDPEVRLMVNPDAPRECEINGLEASHTPPDDEPDAEDAEPSFAVKEGTTALIHIAEGEVLRTMTPPEAASHFFKVNGGR